MRISIAGQCLKRQDRNATVTTGFFGTTKTVAKTAYSRRKIVLALPKPRPTGALVGRGAARDRDASPSLSQFYGPICLFMRGAGLCSLGAWVGVAGRSRCRARLSLLAGLSLLLFRA